MNNERVSFNFDNLFSLSRYSSYTDFHTSTLFGNTRINKLLFNFDLLKDVFCEPQLIPLFSSIFCYTNIIIHLCPRKIKIVVTLYFQTLGRCVSWLIRMQVIFRHFRQILSNLRRWWAAEYPDAKWRAMKTTRKKREGGNGFFSRSNRMLSCIIHVDEALSGTLVQSATSGCYTQDNLSWRIELFCRKWIQLE